jgi:hypothetical protein
VGIRIMANAGYDMREALRLAKAPDVLGTCFHKSQPQMVQLQRLPQIKVAVLTFPNSNHGQHCIIGGLHERRKNPPRF